MINDHWSLVIEKCKLKFLGFVFLLASDAGRLPFKASQIEEFSPSHLTSADHIDSIKPGRMGRENPLHPNSVGNLSHCESRTNSPCLSSNHHPFERLDSLLLSFDNLHVYLHRVAHPEIWEVCPQLLSFDQFHRIHRFLSPVEIILDSRFQI